MDFTEIAAVGGKGGLFKVFKPTRSGIILESLKDGSKLVTGPNSKVSILAEISIYTTGEEGTAPLEEIMRKIYQEFKEDIGLTGTSDPGELKAFLKHILPDYDEDRVYVSDIKKLVNWYNCLVADFPDILKEKPAEDKKAEVDTKEERPVETDEKKSEENK